MRPGSSPWSATPSEGSSAAAADRWTGTSPVSALFRPDVGVRSCPAVRLPPHTAPTPAGPDFSDMSAVCGRNAPERRHYSDMSGLSTLQRTDRQERVRSAPRSGPISAFVPVHRHAPPSAYRPGLRTYTTTRTCPPSIARIRRNAATTQTCPGCRRRGRIPVLGVPSYRAKTGWPQGFDPRSPGVHPPGDFRHPGHLASESDAPDGRAGSSSPDRNPHRQGNPPCDSCVPAASSRPAPWP